MEKGWDATGLLKPLWRRVGGRDALAKLAEITPPATLSAYNSGSRPLGAANARKLARALEVSILELGAPVEEADEKGLRLLDLLQEQAERHTQDVVNLRKDLKKAIERIRVLEARAPGAAGRASKDRP